jgi:uncharacterized protein YaiL (DUF2058 family)
MRNALHEQLLKSGLVDEKRLEEAEREKRRDRAPAQGVKTGRKQRVPHRPPLPAPPPPRVQAEAAQARAQAERRALERDIVQVIKANRVLHNDGDEAYSFVDGRKVGRIYVTAATAARLARGELAIVRLRTRYAVVPTATAAGIAAKAPEFVLVANAGAGEEPLDPAYAAHPIPDDLRW